MVSLVSKRPTLKMGSPLDIEPTFLESGPWNQEGRSALDEELAMLKSITMWRAPGKPAPQAKRYLMSISIVLMTMSSCGRSWAPVGVWAILRTTSIPSTTSPKTE